MRGLQLTRVRGVPRIEAAVEVEAAVEAEQRSEHRDMEICWVGNLTRKLFR